MAKSTTNGATDQVWYAELDALAYLNIVVDDPKKIKAAAAKIFKHASVRDSVEERTVQGTTINYKVAPQHALDAFKRALENPTRRGRVANDDAKIWRVRLNQEQLAQANDLLASNGLPTLELPPRGDPAKQKERYNARKAQKAAMAADAAPPVTDEESASLDQLLGTGNVEVRG